MNILKAFIPLVVCTAVSVSAHAQKCDLDVDKTDEYTKEHVKEGTNKVGPAMWHWKLTLKQSGSKYGWEMQIKWGKHFVDPIKKGDVLFCKLENGKVIQLVADNDYAPSHVASDDGFIVTTYLPKGDLSADDMKALSESPVNGIRVMLAGQKFEPDISSKQGAAIQTTAKCIIAP